MSFRERGILLRSTTVNNITTKSHSGEFIDFMMKVLDTSGPFIISLLVVPEPD